MVYVAPLSCGCIRPSSGLWRRLPFSKPRGNLSKSQDDSTAGACWVLPSLHIPMGMDSLGSAHLAAFKVQGPMDSSSVCTAPGSTMQPPSAYI